MQLRARPGQTKSLVDLSFEAASTCRTGLFGQGFSFQRSLLSAFVNSREIYLLQNICLNGSRETRLSSLDTRLSSHEVRGTSREASLSFLETRNKTKGGNLLLSGTVHVQGNHYLKVINLYEAIGSDYMHNVHVYIMNLTRNSNYS